MEVIWFNAREEGVIYEAGGIVRGDLWANCRPTAGRRLFGQCGGLLLGVYLYTCEILRGDSELWAIFRISGFRKYLLFGCLGRN